MKYYISQTGKLENGPGGKTLNVLMDKKRVTEEEFNKAIDDFFLKDDDVTQENKENGKKLCLEYLEKGKPVTLDNVTLSIKN